MGSMVWEHGVPIFAAAENDFTPTSVAVPSAPRSRHRLVLLWWLALVLPEDDTAELLDKFVVDG